jgi:hypothetical protein
MRKERKNEIAQNHTDWESDKKSKGEKKSKEM